MCGRRLQQRKEEREKRERSNSSRWGHRRKNSAGYFERALTKRAGQKRRKEPDVYSMRECRGEKKKRKSRTAVCRVYAKRKKVETHLITNGRGTARKGKGKRASSGARTMKREKEKTLLYLIGRPREASITPPKMQRVLKEKKKD